MLLTKPGLEVIKLFLVLNSAEHEIYPAHKCKNELTTISGILTFIRRINDDFDDLP